MKTLGKRLAAVFGAVCTLGSPGCTVSDGRAVACHAGMGCNGSARLSPPEPETRSAAALRREAEALFRKEGYEVVGYKTSYAYHALGATDVFFNLRRDGADFTGVVECKVGAPCVFNAAVPQRKR